MRGLDGRRGPAAIGEVIRESSARRHQASSGVIRRHQVSSGVIKHLLFGDPHAMYVRPGWRGGGRERNGAVAMRGCSGHGVGKGAEIGAETGAGHACARDATETQSASQSDRQPGRTARQTLRQIARQPRAERGTASQPQLASQAACTACTACTASQRCTARRAVLRYSQTEASLDHQRREARPNKGGWLTM